ncbi:HET-domain-containing protein [Hypoxylon rubiginosum]|uniref:HET-domain-containing protein n=1 Tax=Hypoxylon rubiginosum TaxID=110542 RepID=A0ACC0DCZ1_9PEZI|nr:HET-domain-containing protein [Hypoxylon rubiginosum]
MMSVFSKYDYEPLGTDDEIRLVTLDPATSEEDPLRCSITNYRRGAKAVDYYAVSYVWGEPVFSQNLEIRHSDDDVSYLKITSNVDALLQRLRALNILRHIWIDAICLNQADENEKAQQIPVMGRIFKEAKGVHIWLGPEDDQTAKIFTFLEAAALVPKAKKLQMSSQLETLMKTVFGGRRNAVKCISDFSKRPWFSRRWIIQEACLARQATVHCGSHSIPLQKLASAAGRFQTLNISSYPIKVMMKLYRPTTSTILKLLWDFQEAQCLDPKDRVAALLGLVAETYGSRLDYTAHWTGVYKQVASSILSAGNNNTRLQVMLHLFEFGAVSVPEDATYPSWIPDWSQSRRRELPYHCFVRNLDTYEPYPNSPGHSPKASLAFDHDALQIQWRSSSGGPRGRQVTYVANFDSPPRNEAHEAEQLINTLNELFPPDSDSTERILAVVSLLKTVTRFRQRGHDSKLKGSPCDASIKNFIQRLPGPSRSGAFKYLRGIDSILKKFYLFEMGSVGPRGQAGTGYGVSSQQIEIGDVVIPLWNMEWKHDNVGRHWNKGEKTTTVLIVRCTEDPSLHSTTSSSNEDEAVATARIVGWAVCVLLGSESSYGHSLSVDTRWQGHLVEEQLCAMRLI